MKKIKLHWQILIAICLAGLVGSITGKEMAIFGVTFFQIFNFIGTLFLNALKMIIVPLIVSSLITGVSGLGGSDSLGRLSGKTLTFYAVSGLLAIIVGLVMVNVISPGIVDGKPAGPSLALTMDEEQLANASEKVQGKTGADIVEVFLRMVPTNIVSAAAEGEMLGLIFFSLLFGYFMTRITPKYAETIQNFWRGVFETMMNITQWIMSFAPIGVFGLVAQTVASTGFEGLKPMLWFMLTVILALAFHAFVTLPILLKVLGRVSPARHFSAMSPSMLTAFSTASSSATLPITMDCVEKNAKVSNRVSSFVLPLGATINMDGTALYECAAAMFIAQAFGFDLSLATQFTVVLIALLTSIGVAGIPSASLVAISVILIAVGLPVEAIGVLLVTDRILDMCRTSVNVFSDTCCAVIIAKSEGEENVLVNEAS
jgi:Na+/H+-dicarboxylate symporter